ncbi:MAG: glycoside hydrolase family 130 protein [Algoriphagus sp.]|jgi:beta-1,2-mannosidase|nr:glycoside hydrolase family 130 protein [Algoriphagus sp.]MDP4748127.1 glycoside hydrolase family 130 protein [Algoriphagus sp.]
MNNHFSTLLILCALVSMTSCNNLEHKVEPLMQNKWEIGPFVKQDADNPILTPDPSLVFVDPVSGVETAFEGRNVLNPSAVVKDGKVHLLYRAQDEKMTSRIGLATSEDGIHFIKEPAPIFFPDNDAMLVYENNGGVEDPRVVQGPEGKYWLTYTSYDGKTARLCIASSPDLKQWTKHGPVLNDPKYIDLWSKSGAIVVEQVGAEMRAKKINGQYWMYFGDTNLYMAYSTNLIDWKVLENAENNKMVSVLHPRPGYFDSRLVEPGPYALWTESGINLIYNASNAANNNDPQLPKFTYAAGQALFSATLPYQLLERTQGYFIYPDKDYEKIGEVNEVCFVEGMVFFKNKWFLYYGTADSKIAVAIAEK